MKKDAIAVPLLPFTDDEQAALTDKLAAMDAPSLGRYVESARVSLANKALDPSWRPRIQFGLDQAEIALQNQPPPVAEPAPVAAPAPVKAVKASKTKAADAKPVEA